jgi:V8-like Glu-specific endopeptidase
MVATPNLEAYNAALFAGDLATANSFSLQNFGEVCPGERYANQPALGECSGFLVGPRTLVTAGHCAPQMQNIGYQWVFNYGLDQGGALYVPFAPADTYTATRVLQSLEQEDGLDYAVLELDRDVAGVTPLKFRRRGSVRFGTPLVVIGHPSGLPTKIAGGGRVLSNRDPIVFSANLDTFSGNSGGPVINARTGEVEGVLVDGADDYHKVTRADGTQCNRAIRSWIPRATEGVVRIGRVAEIQTL